MHLFVTKWRIWGYWIGALRDLGKRSLHFTPTGLMYFLPTLKAETKCTDRRFANSIFICTFLRENFFIWIQISLKCNPGFPFDSKSLLFKPMAWHQTCDEPLSGPKITPFSLTHLCVQRPDWVNPSTPWFSRSPCYFGMAAEGYMWCILCRALCRSQALSEIISWVVSINT